MSTRNLAGDTLHYERVDSTSTLATPTSSTATDVEGSSQSFHSASRPVVRRRRTESTPSPVSAMSLVGLKNLFFRKTITQVPVRQSRRDYGTPNVSSPNQGPLDWSNVSNQPLLRSTDPASRPLIAHSTLDARPLPSSCSEDDTDVESQSSKSEKVNQRKGFRIDARVISDATIGLSDGLTVPFALTAGLSALGNTRVVIYGGFAELIAGAISMGLGGYLGAKSEA